MVIFYSRTQKTRVFAQVLASMKGVPAHELSCGLNQRGMLSFLFKALRLTVGGKTYPVGNIPGAFPSEITVCTPVWGGGIASPMRFFLENANLKDTTINVLLTAGTPVEKYKAKAREYLAELGLKTRDVFIFATSGDGLPEEETVHQHLAEVLGREE